VDVLGEVMRRRGIRELFPPQREAIDAGLLNGVSMVLVTATGSGKSFLAEVAAINAAVRGRKAIYAVPLRALAYERWRSLKQFEDMGIRVAVTTGEYESADTWVEKYDVVITTYEKLDSLLRHRPRWLSDIGLVVIDELHYMADPKRGPVIEAVALKLRRVVRDAQFLGLSATVGNAEKVAEWLDAKLVKSDWRPVPLREGVYVERSGVIVFDDGRGMRRVRVAKRFDDPVVDLAMDSMGRGWQTLVFAMTRSGAVKMAKSLAKALANSLIRVNRSELDRYARRIEEESSSKLLGRELAELVRRGVAFHHAGLDMEAREIIEEAFRERVLLAVVATTTLAAGVNLPARRVIISDYRRFDPAMGWSDIPVMEYKQMVGRAGRPGLDEEGEAIIIADDDREASILMSRYVRGRVEDVTPRLFEPHILRSEVLALVASGYARTINELTDLLRGSLAYVLLSGSGPIKDLLIARKVEAAVKDLARWGFLDEDGGELRATKLGEAITRVYMDPEVAHLYLQHLNRIRRVNVYAVAYLVALHPDVPRVRRGPRDALERAREAVEEAIPGFEELTPDAVERSQALMTAALMAAWADEASEDELLEQFDVGPGDLKVYSDYARWLGHALEYLAKVLELGISSGISVQVRRLVHGVREELLELVELEGVGRVRARALYDAGYRTLMDIARSSPKALASVRGIGEKLAISIWEQARQRTFSRV